jgi:hypothetical protein
MVCTPMPSHFVWEMGHRATWSEYSGGGATALAARGSRPLMVTDGPEGCLIPSSSMRRHARSGRRAWWKVERGL